MSLPVRVLSHCVTVFRLNCTVVLLLRDRLKREKDKMLDKPLSALGENIFHSWHFILNSPCVFSLILVPLLFSSTEL